MTIITLFALLIIVLYVLLQNGSVTLGERQELCFTKALAFSGTIKPVDPKLPDTERGRAQGAIALGGERFIYLAATHWNMYEHLHFSGCCVT